LQAALNQAQLTLSANPLDSDARVVALCSSDLLHDESRFRSFLILPINASELSPPAHAELEALLTRRSLRSLAPLNPPAHNAPAHNTPTLQLPAQ
jgi:hypothetical protein